MLCLLNLASPFDVGNSHLVIILTYLPNLKPSSSRIWREESQLSVGWMDIQINCWISVMLLSILSCACIVHLEATISVFDSEQLARFWCIISSSYKSVIVEIGTNKIYIRLCFKEAFHTHPLGLIASQVINCVIASKSLPRENICMLQIHGRIITYQLSEERENNIKQMRQIANWSVYRTNIISL